MNPYASLLIMAALALLVAVGGLAMSAIISPARRNRVKVANYECGIDPTPANTEHGRFPVSFYLVGMTFIIFDVEVVFLYPSAAWGSSGWGQPFCSSASSPCPTSSSGVAADWTGTEPALTGEDPARRSQGVHSSEEHEKAQRLHGVHPLQAQ